jgi:pyrimidine-nucleoside phosphorylase
MTGTSMVQLIERKKRGEALTAQELEWLCRGFVAREIPDYQVAAWLMAVRWRGMHPEETLALTNALVSSGESFEWPADRPVVDKHSTGGVGDKTSIALVPLLASAGVTFVKMSGRGLGHTGGTIDKLESIPGFQVNLTPDRLREQVGKIGCALIGQSPQIVPADGALYALRDVTATVDSLPLIASSVMSKKLAAGARAIVLDVKYGSGAFMESLEQAEELALAMVAIGEGAGRRIRAVLSPMREPLGRAVGNALEVQEAIDVLLGNGPPDLVELTLELGSQLMVLSGCTPSLDDARRGLQTLLHSGVSADKFEQLIAAQGGDAGVVRTPGRLPRAPVVDVVESPAAGWSTGFDARTIADIALDLGAGRKKKGDPLDPRVGLRLLARTCDRVESGQPVAEIHAADADSAGAARRRILAALRLSPAEVVAEPNEHRVIGGAA